MYSVYMTAFVTASDIDVDRGIFTACYRSVSGVKRPFTYKAFPLTPSIGTVALKFPKHGCLRSNNTKDGHNQSGLLTEMTLYSHNSKDRNVPVMSNHIEFLGTSILLHRLMKTAFEQSKRRDPQQ